MMESITGGFTRSNFFLLFKCRVDYLNIRHQDTAIIPDKKRISAKKVKPDVILKILV